MSNTKSTHETNAHISNLTFFDLNRKKQTGEKSDTR